MKKSIWRQVDRFNELFPKVSENECHQICIIHQTVHHVCMHVCVDVCVHVCAS